MKHVQQSSFEALGKALTRLHEILIHPDIEQFDYLQDAAIQRFEFCIELYWKVLRKVLAFEKIEGYSPRDVFQKSYQLKFIDNEDLWLDMLDARNATSHVYDQSQAYAIYNKIKDFEPLMQATYLMLKQRIAKNNAA